MAAQSSCATSLDGAHDAPLGGGGQGSTMLLAIGIAVATKHVSQFQFRRFYGGWAAAAGRAAEMGVCFVSFLKSRNEIPGYVLQDRRRCGP
jgi:hypothetical protein